jgi:plasmid stability protein
MAQLIVRKLDESVKERLRARAKHHGRTLEAEARSILEEVAAEEVMPLLRNEEKGLGDLMYEHFKDRGLTDEELARFNVGIAEINSRSAMRIPDFEAEDFEESPSGK